jgi:hypothetical protein
MASHDDNHSGMPPRALTADDVALLLRMQALSTG